MTGLEILGALLTILTIVSVASVLQNRAIDSKLDAKVAAPLATLTSEAAAIRRETKDRSDTQDKTLDRIERETRGLDNRVTRLEEWRSMGSSGGHAPYRDGQ